MDHIWIWVIAGLLPYSLIKRSQGKDKQILEVRALFWRLTICWQYRRCSWMIYISLIEHLRQ